MHLDCRRLFCVHEAASLHTGYTSKMIFVAGAMAVNQRGTASCQETVRRSGSPLRQKLIEAPQRHYTRLQIFARLLWTACRRSRDRAVQAAYESKKIKRVV
jgi:hypothetical protein